MIEISYEEYSNFSNLLRDYVNENHVIFSVVKSNSPAVGKFDRLKIFRKDEITATNPELIHMFSSEKHSPAIFKNGKRSNDNWKISFAVSLDCDNGESLDNAKKILNEKGVSYIIAKSKSHGKEKSGKISDRFHVFLIPNHPITDENKYFSYAVYFIDLLRGDKQVKDRARYLGETPNLKEIDVNFDKSFDDSFINSINSVSNLTPPRRRTSIECTRESLSLHIEQVKNYYPQLIFSQVNLSNNTMNWYRNSRDVGPGLFSYYDKKEIYDPSKNEKYILPFSFKNFRDIKSINQNSIQDIKKILDEINLYDKKEFKIDIVKTCEGTGKSLAVIQTLIPPWIFTANTIDRLTEIENTCRELNKNTFRIYGNSDIIYNVVFENRGSNEEAKRIAKGLSEDYEKFFTKKKYSGASSSEIHSEEEFTRKVMNSTANRKTILKSIKKEYLKKDQKENKEDRESISLGGFLEEYFENFYDCEVKMILQEYQNQIDAIKLNKYIYLMTTQKFFRSLKLIALFMPVVRCFQDECLVDIYKPSKIVDEKDQNYRLKVLLSAGKKIIDENNLSSTELEDFSSNGYEYYLTSSFGNATSLLEYKKKDWYKKDNFHITILTTEELPENIIPEAEVYDLSHNMYTPKLNIISVQGLNSIVNSKNVLQGKDRLFYIKELAKECFDIEDEMIISNAMGLTWNFVNSKGTNKFKNFVNDLSTKKESINLGIILTYPHPKQINEKKGFYIEELKRLSKETKVPFNVYLNSKEVEEFIVARIITDDLNQACGRVLGYRDEGKISKVFVFVNSSLIPMIDTRYVTTNVFSYSGLYQLTDSQIKNPDVWDFCSRSQKLHQQGPRLTTSIQWFKRLIYRIKLCWEKLENFKILKRFSKKSLIQRIKNKFDCLSKYLLNNNLLYCNHTKSFIEQQGMLSFLSPDDKNYTNFYKKSELFAILA